MPGRGRLASSGLWLLGPLCLVLICGGSRAPAPHFVLQVHVIDWVSKISVSRRQDSDTTVTVSAGDVIPLPSRAGQEFFELRAGVPADDRRMWIRHHGWVVASARFSTVDSVMATSAFRWFSSNSSDGGQLIAVRILPADAAAMSDTTCMDITVTGEGRYGDSVFEQAVFNSVAIVHGSIAAMQTVQSRDPATPDSAVNPSTEIDLAPRESWKSSGPEWTRLPIRAVGPMVSDTSWSVPYPRATPLVIGAETIYFLQPNRTDTTPSVTFSPISGGYGIVFQGRVFCAPYARGMKLSEFHALVSESVRRQSNPYLAELTGRVVARGSGAALANIPLSVGASRTTTDSLGRFRFDELAAGRQRLKVHLLPGRDVERWFDVTDERRDTIRVEVAIPCETGGVPSRARPGR